MNEGLTAPRKNSRRPGRFRASFQPFFKQSAEEFVPSFDFSGPGSVSDESPRRRAEFRPFRRAPRLSALLRFPPRRVPSFSRKKGPLSFAERKNNVTFYSRKGAVTGSRPRPIQNKAVVSIFSGSPPAALRLMSTNRKTVMIPDSKMPRPGFRPRVSRRQREKRPGPGSARTGSCSDGRRTEGRGK
jgi:hypothetical protein